MMQGASASDTIEPIVKPRVQVTPVVQAAAGASAPEGTGVVRSVVVDGPTSKVNVAGGVVPGASSPVRSSTALPKQRPTVLAGGPRSIAAPEVTVAKARIEQGKRPVRVQPTSGVNRVADIVSAPSAALHKARQQTWKAQDGAREKASELVNSKTIVAARADAAMVRAAMHEGAAAVRDSDVYQDAAKVAQKTARVIEKGTRKATEGATAVAHRKGNNAALLGNYRAQRANAAAAAEQIAAAAEQAVGGAVRMEGENPPAGAPRMTKDGV